MKLIVARSEWMAEYSGREPLIDPRGKWARAGNTPGEAYNFQVAHDGLCYASWEMGGRRLTFSSWPESGGVEANDVCIVFVATEPFTNRFLVVGFYDNARVFAVSKKGQRNRDYRAVAKAEDCYLIPVADRTFEYAYTARQSWFTYGRRAEKSLNTYLTSVRANDAVVSTDSRSIIEGRRSILAQRMERFQSGYLRSLVIGGDGDLSCAACGLQHQPKDHVALKRRFEVHHLELVSKIENGKTRSVKASDLAVLCASCHRAIHSSAAGQYVSDIAAFRKNVLGIKA